VGGGGEGSVHKKKELLQLVDLDLNPPVKHAGLVPVRLGKLNKTVTRQWITGTGNTAGAQRLSTGKPGKYLNVLNKARSPIARRGSERLPEKARAGHLR